MLELAVFLCGAVVMVLELTGSRVLAPFLGTSIVVWTSLIGVVLGSMSLGYWWGGRVADKRPEARLLSRLILLAALSTLLLAGLKGLILAFLQNKASLHWATLASTLVLFVPVSTLLGMVSPFAVRLRMESTASSGRTAGNLYALSTVGSITGTFAAGFWLTATLGTTNIILCMAGALVLASACVHRGDMLLRLIVCCALTLAALGLARWDGQLRQVGLFDLDTGYQRVLVFNSVNQETSQRMRVMTTGPEGMQSGMDPADPAQLVLPYTRYYRLAEHFRPGFREMLMLGGGGYSFPKYVRAQPGEFGSDAHLDVVEIDPGVTDIARRMFHLEDNPGLTVFHDDARRFLNRARAQAGGQAVGQAGEKRPDYQVVLVDVFTSHYSVPFHLTTKETVQALSDVLDKDGVVLVNCISAAEGPKSRFYRALLATYRSVFPRVESFLVGNRNDPAEFQNIMLAAFKSPRAPQLTSPKADLQAMLDARYDAPATRPGDPPVLTDDFAPVDHYLLSL